MTRAALDPTVNKRHNRAKMVIIYICVLLMLWGCSLPLFPDDDTRENIPLAEVQRLVPFEICQPSQLPDGVESSPQVVYHAEGGNPDESDVRLRYYFLENHELAIEVFQKHAPGRLATPHFNDPASPEAGIRELLAWEVGWSKMDEMRKGVTTDVTLYEDGDLERGLFEILDPPSLQANMIMWGKEPVFYRLFTRLSADKAKQVVESMSDCSPKLIGTPTSR